MNDMIKMEGGQEAISVKKTIPSSIGQKVLIPKVKKSEMWKKVEWQE